MAVTLHIPGVLARYSDGERELVLDGASLGEVLEASFARFPDLRGRVLDAAGAPHPYLHLFVNETRVTGAAALGAAIAPGDVLEIIPAAGGGGPSAGSPAERYDPADVRMRGFRQRTPVPEAIAVALDGAAALASEPVPITACAGRVLAIAIESAVDVPPFRRAAMDGYAVHGEDTFGATAYDPLELRLTGEVLPGGEAALPEVGPGDACRIMTGAEVPPGANAVLKAEEADEADGTVRARVAVSPGKHVAAIGEDIARGDRVLEAGRRLRPQDVGLLASIGCHPVPVIRRPRVRVLVTGTELLPPGEAPRGRRIVDSNSPMLAALLDRDGAVLDEVCRLPDDRAAIAAALTRGGVDVVIAAGGSSVGREDFLPGLVRAHGELPIHGVAMRPSAPTGIGRIDQVRVFLLPGNPVSCLAAYDTFAGPLVRRLGGLPERAPYPIVELPLARRIASVIGRLDYARVAIRDGRVDPIAISGASILSSVTRADGYVLVPAAREGIAEGEVVAVHLYEPWPAA